MKERTVRCPVCGTEVGVRSTGVLRMHGDRGGQPCSAGGRSAVALPSYNTLERMNGPSSVATGKGTYRRFAQVGG